MKTFGDHLKNAREARGVTIDSIANATRISRRYLHALERSDLETLPGGAFDKGYIKACAEFLEIDAGPILEAYANEAERRGLGTPERQRQMLEEMGKLAERSGRVRTRRRSLALVAVPLVLSLAGGVLWLALRREPSEVEPGDPAEAARPAPVVVRQMAPSPPPTEPAPPSEEPHELRVTQSGIGTEIVARNLEGTGTHFVEGTKLWYWTRVVGGASGGRVRHVWIHEGKTAMLAELSVEGSHWRTYSTFTPPPGSTGRWVVEARTIEDEVLARDSFVCLSAHEGT